MARFSVLVALACFLVVTLASPRPRPESEAADTNPINAVIVTVTNTLTETVTAATIVTSDDSSSIPTATDDSTPTASSSDDSFPTQSSSDDGNSSPSSSFPLPVPGPAFTLSSSDDGSSSQSTSIPLPIPGPAFTITSSDDGSSSPSTIVPESPSTTEAAPLTVPTSWLSVTAARSGSPIHLLPMNAAGLRFYLGGHTVSYCPTQVMNTTGCPDGNTTVMSLCGMGVEVPGGQQIYVTPGGEIGYTQAHSMAMPPESVLCPFTYTKAPGAYLGHLIVLGGPFNAIGLMACPTGANMYWQVFAGMSNATVPTGNVTDCIGFDPLAVDAPGLGAWQYS